MYLLSIQTNLDVFEFTSTEKVDVACNDDFNTYPPGTYTIDNANNGTITLSGDLYSSLTFSYAGIVTFILDSNNTTPISLRNAFKDSNTIKTVNISNIPLYDINSAFTNSTIECFITKNTGKLLDVEKAFMNSNINHFCGDVSEVKSFVDMFKGTKNLYSICCLDTSKGEQFYGMFVESSIYNIKCLNTAAKKPESDTIKCTILKCDASIKCLQITGPNYFCDTLFDCSEKMTCTFEDIFTGSNPNKPNPKYVHKLEDGYNYTGECK